ncbi:hypothetical protein D8804_08440 [Streptococcus oralis]|uniref:Uncharacterized protein n=1 Tax=Streptococcus oralis TaxID=1303 RepID=A0A3R9LDG9_STROR|nr:hypothetical protein [Streptococcus oralis]RSK07949.1 hypothetical protein D8804_08440 [Streptococcus oralis]
MKGNMRKDYLYRYLLYRFEKETFKNSALEGINQETKERICQQATKTTRRISVFVGLVYLILFCLIIIWLNANCSQNPFFLWYQGYIESLFPLINGDWGSSWIEKKGTILWIAIKAFPIFVLNGAPFLLLVLLIANRTLKKKLKVECIN